MQSPSFRAEDDEVGAMGEWEKTEMTSRGTEPLVLRRQLHTCATIDDIYTDQSEPKTACDVIKSACRVSPKCLGGHMLNYFPFIRFLRTYHWRNWILSDAISGLSVGFIHLPQGLGFGLLASLSPVSGLYTTFFPILVYLLFGTSPHVSMGTNALIALLTANLVDKEAGAYREGLGANATWSAEEELKFKVGISAASCFVGGVILLAMGLLRLGFITNFLSKSFVGGFTFSAAVHIFTSQFVKMLNIKIPGHSGIGKLVKTYIDIFKTIAQANPADVIIGLICMAVLLAVKIGINERYKKKMKVPVPIELIVVILATIVSHFAELHDNFGVLIVGDVPAGLPAPTLPDMDSLPRVASDAFVTAILIFTLTISLAKLTAKLHDITIDDNQEMVAYGLCSMVGAFFQNFPPCTAPPRTMMLSSLGARSTMNGVTSAVFILVVLLVAGQLFVSLPIAMLAAMIIVAIKDLLLQVRNLKSLWHVNRADFFIWVVTAVFSIFGDLDIGLLAGVVFSMITVMVIGQLAQGRLLGKATDEDLLLTVNRKGIYPVPGVKVFRFEAALYFATQERFKSQLYRLVLNPASVPARKDTVIPDPPSKEESLPSDVPEEKPVSNSPAFECNGKEETDHEIRHVVLDCSAMTYIDVSGVDMLKLVMTQFSRVGVEVWLAEVPAGTLGTLERAGFTANVGKEKIFYSVMDALHRLQKAELYCVRL
ncbi:hypothetical protein ACOMHN_065566 [Nucella lapillus]